MRRRFQNAEYSELNQEDIPLKRYSNRSDSNANTTIEHSAIGNSEEITLKCKNCNKFYLAKEKNGSGLECHFHPGYFGQIKMLNQWSCCSNTLFDAPPCSVGEHVECLVTSQNIRDYRQMESQYINSSPLSMDSSFSSSKQEEKEEKREIASEPKKGEEKEKEVVASGQLIRHQVKTTDTMLGLSIKYNVKAEDIKRANKLTRDGDLITRLFVLIPNAAIETPPIQTQQKLSKKQLIQKFIEKTNCPPSEASFYLEGSNFDLEEAIKDFNEDESWEKSPSGKSLDHSQSPIRV
eukprot:TRINITY_DN2889_c0_g1_i1.p1 TRINITY_DN2889_c0_g1~~TRINITY_DN2889_c0_g1_i1.p1  ORF type:complete len:293 (+),score=130.13 TRINITY_DN2889_c0_g1_i1:120-998(+)